jgi:serine phosphatase RsbU (regulator of sigma subunit)
MVSVVCSTALNRAVLEFKLTDPGEVLDKTRELVVSTFEKNDKEVRDGMDISLCVYDTASRELKWAGANMALWLIQNQEARAVKANKQPIGKFEKSSSFTTHSIQLNKGDLFFMVTDGFADQFGGPQGKKFKYKQLVKLFVEHADKAMQEQQRLFDKVFENWKDWKGESGAIAHEQVDDVCLVGVRV